MQAPSSKYCLDADRHDFRRSGAGIDASSVRLSRIEISWNFDGCILIEMSDASVKVELRPSNERVKSTFEAIVKLWFVVVVVVVVVADCDFDFA